MRGPHDALLGTVRVVELGRAEALDALSPRLRRARAVGKRSGVDQGVWVSSEMQAAETSVHLSVHSVINKCLL